jgi:hypothetical protein
MVDEPSSLPEWMTFLTDAINTARLKIGTSGGAYRIYDTDGTTLRGAMQYSVTGAKLIVLVSNASIELTDGNIDFITNGNTALTISTGGNVGIGIDPSVGKLEVKVATGFGTDGDNQVIITDGAATNPQEMRLGVNTASNYSYIQSAHRASAWADLILNPFAGNVGIGTTTIDSKLHVEETTANTACKIKVESLNWDSALELKNGNGSWEIYNDYSDSSKLKFYNGGDHLTISSGGTVEVNSGNELRVYRSDNARYGTFYTDGSYVHIAASTDPIKISSPERVEFHTAGSERMRISSGGNVGIGRNIDSTNRLIVKGIGSTSSTYCATFANSSDANIVYFRDDKFCYFYGDLTVNGTKNFQINHPLESKKDTHYLVHSCIESPEVNNLYRGKVNLVNGTAEVNLDEVSTMTEGTFIAINNNIQCFTTNESDWDAVKGSVKGNILTIECQNNESSANVSWMVIGERQDEGVETAVTTDLEGKLIVEPLKPIIESKEEEEEEDEFFPSAVDGE